MVYFPETMDWGTILSPSKYPYSYREQQTKAGKTSSFNISKYDILLTLLSKTKDPEKDPLPHNPPQAIIF